MVNFYLNARKVAARGTGFQVTPRLFIIVPDQRLRELGLDDEPHKISHAHMGIPRSRPRLGQAAGRNHAGSPHSLSRENGSMIFGSI